jgi:hypothetical protein
MTSILSNLSDEKRKEVSAMTADQYGAALKNGFDDASLGSKQVSLSGEDALELMPPGMPSKVDNARFEQHMANFLAAYPQVNPSQNNVKTIGDWLKKNRAVPSFNNLVIAFEALFPVLELRIEVDVTPHAAAIGRTDHRDKPNPKKPKGLYIATAQPQRVSRETEIIVVLGSTLTAQDHAKLMKPVSAAPPFQNVTADEMKTEMSATDPDPAIILARVESAIRSFRSKFPQYEPTEENRAIMELYLDQYKCDRANPQSYEMAFRFFQQNPHTMKHFESPVDPITHGNTTVVTREPHHGIDPTFDLTPQLRRKLRLMGSQEYYEWCAQHPEAAKELDKTGL